MAFGKHKAVALPYEQEEKSSKSMILLKVLIYLICAFAVITSGMQRIHDANMLVGSTEYTVTSSYGTVVTD